MYRRSAVLAFLAASSTYAMPNDFFAAGNNDVCATKDLTACSSSLPSGFCCPQGAQCQSLAGGTTALCCPAGSSCDRIRPIACDVNLQDPKGKENPSVITSVFNVNLEPCDNGCCPFGYSCTDKESKPQCMRNDDQSKKPSADGDGKSTTTTATTITTKTQSGTSSSTATSTATSQSTTPASATATPAAGSEGGDSEKGMKSRTMSIIGGVVGGSLVLLIIVIIVVLYLRRRRRRSGTAAQQYEKSTGYRTGTSSSSASHHARALQISEPIVQQDSYRTDFILKSPSTMSSISNQPVNSRWSGSTHAGAGRSRSRTRNLTPSAAVRRAAQKHLSIPNPFSSPNASPKPDSVASSFDDSHAKTGHVVNARLAPIRSMRSSTRRVSRHTEPQQVVRKEASEESINVFADANAVPPLRQQQRGREVHEERGRDRMTTFSDLMDKADLGDAHRGKQHYVPGTTPRL